MKKLLSIVSILLLTISLNAQNYRLPTPNADSIPDMVVYDREGNLYNVNDLRFALPSTDNPQLLPLIYLVLHLLPTTLYWLKMLLLTEIKWLYEFQNIQKHQAQPLTP